MSRFVSVGNAKLMYSVIPGLCGFLSDNKGRHAHFEDRLEVQVAIAERGHLLTATRSDATRQKTRSKTSPIKHSKTVT